MNENRIGYEGFFDWMSFSSILNNAFFKEWTGILRITWDDTNLNQIYRGTDLNKMLFKRAHIILNKGVISNVLFDLKPSPDVLDEKLSLNNLLLLIRAFEGVGQPKINGHALYTRMPEVTELPNTLNIDANLITSYSLLADEQAFKNKSSDNEWPDTIE